MYVFKEEHVWKCFLYFCKMYVHFPIKDYKVNCLVLAVKITKDNLGTGQHIIFIIQSMNP